MIPYQRRSQMLQLLEKQEVVSLDDFCRELNGVSKSTIRRDLKTMEAEGQITLLRGGGACLKQGSYEMPVNSKNVQYVNEKERIARYAASLVKDGESVYIDSGTTPLRMIKHLRNRKITVVTTNALVLTELQEAKLQCFMVGGEINISTASILGTTTNSELSTKYFDKAFLGGSAFSERAGITTPDIREAEKKQIVKSNSKETYVLADSSKAGKTMMCKIFNLADVTIISEKMTDALESGGNYLIANPDVTPETAENTSSDNSI